MATLFIELYDAILSKYPDLSDEEKEVIHVQCQRDNYPKYFTVSDRTFCENHTKDHPNHITLRDVEAHVKVMRKTLADRQ